MRTLAQARDFAKSASSASKKGRGNRRDPPKNPMKPPTDGFRPQLVARDQTDSSSRRSFPETSLRGRDSKGATVGTYRLYGLDGVGKVVSAEWIDADTDPAAIEAAKKMMDGLRYELWERSRLVIAFDNLRKD